MLCDQLRCSWRDLEFQIHGDRFAYEVVLLDGDDRIDLSSRLFEMQ